MIVADADVGKLCWEEPCDGVLDCCTVGNDEPDCWIFGDAVFDRPLGETDTIDTRDEPECDVIAFEGLRPGVAVLCNMTDWKPESVAAVATGRVESVVTGGNVVKELIEPVEVAVPEYIPPSTNRTLYANMRLGLVIEFPNTTELLW